MLLCSPVAGRASFQTDAHTIGSRASTGRLREYGHCCEIGGCCSRRHRRKIHCGQKHDRQNRVANKDRRVATSDFRFSGGEAGLLCDFHCIISNKMTLGLTRANRALDVSSSLKILIGTAAECELCHSLSKQIEANCGRTYERILSLLRQRRDPSAWLCVI
jgi:hypothetical protein